jgi:hypothetical protein
MLNATHGMAHNMPVEIKKIQQQRMRADGPAQNGKH